MRALTVAQPWAWALVAGHKTVENRTRPPEHMPGRELDALAHGGMRVLIHAGATAPDEEMIALLIEQGIYDRSPRKPAPWWTTGAIVGEVTIVCGVPRTTLLTALSMLERRGKTTVTGEEIFSDWDPDALWFWSSPEAGGGAWAPWCWLVADATEYARPVPATGRQGFWKPPSRVLAAIERGAVAPEEGQQ